MSKAPFRNYVHVNLHQEPRESANRDSQIFPVLDILSWTSTTFDNSRLASASNPASGASIGRARKTEGARIVPAHIDLEVKPAHTSKCAAVPIG